MLIFLPGKSRRHFKDTFADFMKRKTDDIRWNTLSEIFVAQFSDDVKLFSVNEILSDM